MKKPVKRPFPALGEAERKRGVKGSWELEEAVIRLN